MGGGPKRPPPRVPFRVSASTAPFYVFGTFNHVQLQITPSCCCSELCFVGHRVHCAGLRSCRRILGAWRRCPTLRVNENRPDLGAYIGYIDGALTTASRLTAGTFDVSPFILPGPFAAIVANICRQAPTQLFELAVRAGVEALARARVAASSPIVEMTVGENRMSLRAETVTAVQTRLRALNLIRDNPDGRFGAATQEGLRRFQTANQLTVTGLPDPDTILALLVRTR